MKRKMALAVLAGMAMATVGVWAQGAKTVSSGKTLYGSKCASCHGKQGEGVAKMATMLKAKIRSFGEVAATADTLAAWKKITTDGKGKMPAFKTRLSAGELDSVMAYVATLAKPAKSGNSGKGANTDSTKEVK